MLATTDTGNLSATVRQAVNQESVRKHHWPKISQIDIEAKLLKLNYLM